MQISFFKTGVTLLSLLPSSFAALEGHCPPLGKVLNAPLHPSSHDAVESAVAALKLSLDNTTSTWNSSGLSIGLKSIHEDELLLEYAYTPENVDPRGVDKVDSDSVFRIASLSKVFPVLAILQLKGVDFDDPITEYIPELRKLKDQARTQSAIWTVDWDDITIGALASHLGGIGADRELNSLIFVDRLLTSHSYDGSPASWKLDSSWLSRPRPIQRTRLLWCLWTRTVRYRR